jgi:hypothetical protein
VDAFSRKAQAETDGAYDARSLCHKVIVPLAPQLGFSIGVTGREPLNNQPYFRVSRATKEDLLPLVKANAREQVKILDRILRKLEATSGVEEAQKALRAFIRIRQEVCPAVHNEESRRGRTDA